MILMKEATSPNLKQVTLVLRFTTGLLALLSAFAFTSPLLRAAHAETFLTYQFCGVLLSLIAFTLTFERHFPEYWHIEAALFFCLSLMISDAIGLVINSPIPLKAFIVAVPIATVLLPWDWRLQLGICGLCVGSALLAGRVGPTVLDSHPLWMIVAAESA